MSKKTDIKTCRFAKCTHSDKKIDISKDLYRSEGRMYYHSDCYELKKKNEWKDENTKKDLQYIKNQWVLHINNTVIYSQLFQCLNDLLSRGITSDYLVFVLDYIVKNNMKLSYPQGFKYYVDRQDIKTAYKKHLILKNRTSVSDFGISDDDSNSPKFKIKQKPSGFQRILGGDK